MKNLSLILCGVLFASGICGNANSSEGQTMGQQMTAVDSQSSEQLLKAYNVSRMSLLKCM